MRIKIISDGFSHNTKVVNEETGEPIEGIKYIQWSIDASEGIASVTMLFADLSVEVSGDSDDNGGKR